MRDAKAVFTLACAAVLFYGAPAAADGAPSLSASSSSALMVHPTQTKMTKERGVSVYRRANPPSTDDLAGAEPAPCVLRETVIVLDQRDPPRRLRSQGFWSGTGPTSKSFTQGFFADRTDARGGRANR